MRQFSVDETGVNQRADVFIAQKLGNYTRSSLSKLFNEKLVKLNGKVAKTGDKLNQGDKIVVDDRLLKAEPTAIELPIIFENSDVIVIDKPAGVLTHSKGALNLEPTIASFIKPKLNDKSLTGNRAGIVHRLDRVTSGLVICAKNSQSMKWLQKQFADRKVRKLYSAIVEGRPDPESAIIDIPIERNPKKPQTFRASKYGKPAQTKYTTKKTFTVNNKAYSYLELEPHTGRTHQLRIHLAYIGHPIVGDYVYGTEGQGLMLHAKTLEVKLRNGGLKKFTSPEPINFKNFSHEK